MDKRILFIGIAIAIIAIGFLVIKNLEIREKLEVVDNSPLLTGETKEFDIIAKKWDFEPATIEVNKGDKVILNIESIDVAHGIALRDFGVNKRLEPGETANIEFIADKPGEFSFSCNVFCGEGHGAMKGKLIVK